MRKRKITAITVALVLLLFAVPIIVTAFESPTIDLSNTKKIQIDGVTYQVNKKTEQAKVLSFDGSSNEVVLQTQVECWEKLFPVTEISSSAFLNSTELESVVIGEGVTTLGSSVFLGCNSLTEVHFPSTLETISKKAFSGCSSLLTVIIPDGVNCLKNSTFENCTSLQSVFVSKSLLTVEGDAFVGCTALQTVWYEADERARESMFVAEVGNEAFLQATWNYYYCSKNQNDPYHDFGGASEMVCQLCGYEKSDDDDGSEGGTTPDVPSGGGDPVERNLPGDINADGKVDREDVYYLMRYLSKEVTIPDGIDCDLNRDKEVTKEDAKYLLYHIVFGTDLFPLE